MGKLSEEDVKEMLHINSFRELKKEQLKYAINIENIYLIEKAFKHGKGCILLSAHYFNL